MLKRPVRGRPWLVAGVVTLAGVAGATRLMVGSDHQDTPFVELNPRSDLTDVYAFPGSATGRIVLTMDTRAFLTPARRPTPPRHRSTTICSTNSRSTPTATRRRTRSSR